MRAAFLFIVLLIATHSIVFSQDIIHTKSGSSFTGRITEEIPNVQIIIQDISGNRHAIAWDDIERIERGQWLGEKNPVASWALSFFLLPGIGQFYNGDNGQGVANLALHIMSLSVFLSTDDRPAIAGGVVCVSNWIWSFVDAPMRSNEINRDRGYADYIDIGINEVGLTYNW
jgi:hypothetical protein